jgi:hypothetical protein
MDGFTCELHTQVRVLAQRGVTFNTTAYDSLTLRSQAMQHCFLVQQALCMRLVDWPLLTLLSPDHTAVLKLWVAGASYRSSNQPWPYMEHPFCCINTQQLNVPASIGGTAPHVHACTAPRCTSPH